MLQDLSHHRRTEVEFINGAVVRAGAGLGLAAPVNQTLTRLVLALEQARLRPRAAVELDK
jgi:2-dehydropantoate 2-reductase